MSERIIVEKSKITALADSIRTNTGRTEKLTLDEVANIVASLKDYSGFLLTDTLEEYSNDTLTALKEYAFYKNTKLTNVDLPKLTEIPAYAFAYTGLTNVDLANITNIGKGAFLGSNYAGEAIVKDGYGQYIFQSTKITELEYNNSKGGYYSEYNFVDCTELEKVKLRTAIYFGSTDNLSYLQNCTKLKKVWLSKTAAAKPYYGSTSGGLLFGAPTDLEFYVEADAMTGYGWKESTAWTLLATDTYATVHYGITEEEFDKL